MSGRKRTHGSGTITRRANDRFTAQVTDARTGRRQSLGTFDSRRAAEREIAWHAIQPTFGGEQMIFGEYLSVWAESRVMFVGAVTADRYAKDLRRYVLSNPLAAIRLGELQATDFRHLYTRLAAEGGQQGRPLSDHTVAGVDRMLRAAIHTAIEDGALLRDPLPKERVRIVRRERPWADADQIGSLLATTARFDADLEVAVRLGVLYGFRRGEVAGLTWWAISPDSVRIAGSRIIVNGRAVNAPPKTPGSAATVIVDEATMAVIHAHRARRESTVEGAIADDEHVYVSLFGHPLYPDTLTERLSRVVRMFNETHADRPLPPGFTFHSLRHSFASNLIAAGASTLVVAAALRHSSPRLVEETYGHLAPSTVALAVARLAESVATSPGGGAGAGRRRGGSATS